MGIDFRLINNIEYELPDSVGVCVICMKNILDKETKWDKDGDPLCARCYHIIYGEH